MVVQDKPNYRDISQGETGSNDRKQRLRERFEVVKKLGQGTYGKVQLAVNKETKQEVAIKTIKKAKIENEQDLVRIRREIQIMSSIHHPHIIHIYEVFENQEKIVLIMQYASGGELYDYLGCRKKLDENEARRVFRQVASAIFYCHKNHICHRDLKLENILLDDRGNAKIADFGLSNVFDERSKLKTFCGSPLYASPEIVRGTPYCGPEVDCWSLGVLLYTLVYGSMPFDGSNFKRLVKQISEGEYFEPKEKSGASGLIRRLLTVDINFRATIRDICSDLWVNKGYDHSLLKIASDMANLTPVRLDLLGALSPAASSPATDQSGKNQVTIKPAENRRALFNGYYSKSHPLHVPENSENRRRVGTTADGGSAYNAYDTKVVGKQQPVDAASNAQKLADELNDDKKGQRYLHLTDAKATSAAKVPATVKHESNTLIIVQDLIKDVISKVEKHINGSKMEFLRSNDTKSMNQKPVENKVVKDTSEELSKSESLQSSPGGAIRSCSLQKSELATATEANKSSQDSHSDCRPSSRQKTLIQTTGIVSASDKSKVTPEKTVEANIFSERRKSIPNNSLNPQSRKSSIQLMEPDVVIPIFNVCSNIPKRSVDVVRPLPEDTKPNVVQSIGPSEPASKTINSESLTESQNKNTVSSSGSNTDKMPNSRSKDSALFESQLQVRSEETPQHQTTAAESIDGEASSTQESSAETEPPKLPPRGRFLVKIPKQEKSIDKDATAKCETNDSKKLDNYDKQVKKVEGNEKLTFQKADRDFKFIPSTGDKSMKSSVGSVEDATQDVNQTENVESGPTLSQRRSRRDCNKRCLSFNSKRGVDREQSQVFPEKHNLNTKRREQPEIERNAAKELNDCSLSSHKHDESSQVIKDSSDAENKAVKSQEFSAVAAVGKSTEMSERKTENVDLPPNYVEFQETERSFRPNEHEEENKECKNSISVKDIWRIVQLTDTESRRSRTVGKSKQRSLSRTRAMSMEFESLALMPLKIPGPPKKPPGKVEIPKSFDPTQPVTSPKAEMKEIIFIPTACVSDNKEKIEKKIEKVKISATRVIIPPRRKSDAGISSKKKKYTRSKTDFIVRPGDLEAEGVVLVLDDEQQDAIYREIMIQNEQGAANVDGETVSREMWYSVVSPDNESEDCDQRFKAFGERVESIETFEGFYNENDVTEVQNNQLHRHSVDTESGYWTPPEMTPAERPVGQVNMKVKDEKLAKNSEKIMLQRAAFRNSKMRMKLSDEGLDMSSLSSSLESGIYSWRQEETNGKRISPDSESAHKILSPLKFAEMTSDGSYAPIARSFRKMTFPPEHSSTSESIVGDTEKNVGADTAAVGRENRISQRVKSNVDSKPIKPSDSQSSYGSNDISDDVFETWTEKEDAPNTPRNDSVERIDNRSAMNANKSSGQGRKARKSQRGEIWHSYSTDKESSDNDDDLDLMIDESYQGVYGTEGLWQFLKSVNQHLTNQLKTASQKTSPKPMCHRSKSQESKHPDEVVSQKRPVTRSLSREEKQRKGGAQLRHFVSDGKLANADSMDGFEDSYTRFDETRYSSGYMASGSSLDDSGMAQKDFMSSADSFYSHSNDISVYGTLRKGKYFQSSSAVSSPCLIRRKKSLQSPCSSVDISSICDNPDDVSNEEFSALSNITEQNKKLSLYGTLRPKHLSQQGKAQSQILLSTDDGYQLLYNERPKKDSSSETWHGSLGSLTSSATKASSELNVNTIKDYEKLLLSDHKNSSIVDSTYHTTNEKSRVKKIVSDKANRRVSFSSDVKASKSDYHTTIRQNSLNKVREANEELMSTSTHKSNTYTYDEEPEGGSLLEALKTYGYRGIMSQKLQSNTDKYEPRINYRIPTECFLGTSLCSTEWDNFEYIPVENTFAYQQAMYSSIDPVEYCQSKIFSTGPQMKRNITTTLPCDDDLMFHDILRTHRLPEDDLVTRRKPVHKFQDLGDLHLTQRDKYAGENWDSKIASSTRKKSYDSTVVAPSTERRNSGPEKSVQHERERDKEKLGSAEVSESRGSKQSENTIEILSEKIQALKSRCQRKSVDENKLKKELAEVGILASESKSRDKAEGSEAVNERVRGYPDSLEDLSAPDDESSESVSDRIWRKSFYSRFNDASTPRRKKSSLLDSEFLSGYSFPRSSGKFNVDEEGGVEEPWISTTLKRRNSRRSLPRQILRTPSQNSDSKEGPDCSSVRYKRGEPEAETKYKTSRVNERRRSLSQSDMEEQTTSVACHKSPTTDGSEKIVIAGKNRPNTPNTPQGNSDSNGNKAGPKGNRSDTAKLARNSGNGTNDSTDVCSVRKAKETTGNSANKQETAANLKNTDDIPEVKPDSSESDSVSNGCENSDSCAADLKNQTLSQDDSSTCSKEKPKNRSEFISDKHKATENSAEPSVEVTDTKDHRRGNDKE